MKIKVTEKIVVEPQIIQKSTTPSGNAYYQIDYLYQDFCIHSASTGCISGNPNPIDMLDRKFTVSLYHFQDIPNPDPQPTGKDYEGRTIKAGSLSEGGPSRPCWWEEVGKTHRQAIIDAVAQIMED